VSGNVKLLLDDRDYRKRMLERSANAHVLTVDWNAAIERARDHF